MRRSFELWVGTGKDDLLGPHGDIISMEVFERRYPEAIDLSGPCVASMRVPSSARRSIGNPSLSMGAGQRGRRSGINGTLIPSQVGHSTHVSTQC